MDYSNKLTQSIRSVKRSGIRRFFDIVNEMDNVISLSVGEPDFQTPWHVREAGIRRLVLVVGYAASFLFKTPPADKELTIYGYLEERKNK